MKKQIILALLITLGLSSCTKDPLEVLSDHGNQNYLKSTEKNYAFIKVHIKNTHPGKRGNGIMYWFSEKYDDNFSAMSVPVDTIITYRVTRGDVNVNWTTVKWPGNQTEHSKLVNCSIGGATSSLEVLY